VVTADYSREVDAVPCAFGVTPSPEMLERSTVLVDLQLAI